MESSRRRFTTHGEIASRLALVAALLGGCVAGCSSPPPPSFAPRVVKGEGLLDKRLVFHDPRMGGISDIALFPSASDADAVLIVAGTGGAAFLNPATYEVLRTIYYNDGSPPWIQHSIVDADADGDPEFLRLPDTSRNAVLYDDDGVALWKAAAPGRGSSFAFWGDCDGDGKLDVLLGSFPSDKVQLVNHRGETQWRQRWDRWQREIRFVDLDANGKDEMVYVDGKSLNVRSGDGALVRKDVIEEARYVNRLELLDYPFDTAGSNLLLGFRPRSSRGYAQVYRVVSFDGDVLVENIAPGELRFYLTRYTLRRGNGEPPLRVGADEIKHQGVIVGFSATRLSLNLFEMNGSVAYTEVIKAKDHEIARGDGAFLVVPHGGGGSDRLLVGYDAEMWEYTVRER